MKLSVKLAGVAAAFAFALTAVTPASAQTAAELQALIAQLQSQIAALSGTTTATTTFTYTRDLTIGSTGSDVVALQSFLESKGVLVIPAGTSKGYFGALTQSALAKYQASVGIVPAAGYFGPVTKAKVQGEGTITTPGTGTPTNPGTVSGGEASLESFDFQSEDDAQEGEMMHVATIEFDVEDADVKIDRVDLQFAFDGQGSADSDPWDVFETITLMVDGEEIAEEDIDDEDEWLRDDSPFVFRLSNVDYIAEEGDTVEIEVYLTAMDNVDGAEEGDAEWIIAVSNDGIRGTDGEGIQQYVGEVSETVAFEVDVLGEGEEIEIKSSSSDPDATTLLVDADEDSEWHEVFIFELEAEDNDIELDELVLLVNIGTADYDVVVDDLYIEIDGTEFDDYEVEDGDDDEATLTFDLDGDATVDADDMVEVVVFAKFRDQQGNYATSTETIQVSTVSVSGEGLDDVSDTATVSGSVHTLSTSVAEITNVSWVKSESQNGSTGILDLFFTVTAEEEDFEVLGADIDDTVNGTFATSTGVQTVSDKGQLTRISGDSVTTLGGNAGFEVNEGDTVRFRVRYETTTAGSHEVTVESVAGQELDDEDQLSPTVVLE